MIGITVVLPLRLIHISNLRSIIASAGHKLRVQVVLDMKLMMNHVDSEPVLACAWEYDVSNCTVQKIDDMYPKIAYKFRLGAKEG